MGLPPSWTPPYFLKRFKTAQASLFIGIAEGRWGDREIRKRFDFLARTDVSATGRLRLVLTLQGKPRKEYDEDVIFLVGLYKAVALGEREGLEVLAGQDAVFGRQQRHRMKEWGKKRGKDQTMSCQIERRTWNDKAIRLLAKNPRLSKTALARSIKRDGNVSKSVQTIRKRLTVPT